MYLKSKSVIMNIIILKLITLGSGIIISIQYLYILNPSFMNLNKERCRYEQHY